MKTNIIIIILNIFLVINTFANIPNKFQYQIYVRDANGEIISNQTVSIFIKILNENSIEEYAEKHVVATNDFGLAVLTIGAGTEPSTTFSLIPWSSGIHYISLAIDINGGTDYGDFSTSELLSVPYALCSNSCSQSGGSISIVNYGAFPSPDWAHAIDNTTAIQDAIDANPGKTILFPAGFYRTSSDIIVRNNVVLVGEGVSNTIIQSVNCNGFVITSNSVAIKDMFISGFNTSSKRAIYCSNVYNTLIENVSIMNYNTGIELVSSWNTRIDKAIITFNEQTPQIEQGIRIQGKSVNNYISNCQINAKTFGIAIIDIGEGPEGLMITNCLISQCKAGIYSEGILSLHVSNCIIDLITEWALHLKKTTGLLLTNCWIAAPYGSSNPANEQAIYLSESTDCHISNNNLKTFGGARVITIDYYSRNNTITNNTIELGNINGNHIFLDETTSYNLVKDNVLRWTDESIATKPRIIINDSEYNIIKDNLHFNN